MIEKMQFITRTNEIKNKATAINAQNIIDYFVSLHPDNKLIAGSPLYRVAVQQYNDSIQATTIRPPVPTWFCGKVDPVTGELSQEVDDAAQRASAGFVSELPTTPIPTGAATPSNYVIDTCLQYGTPGSSGYAQCKSTLTDDTLEMSGIDWSSSMLNDNVRIGTEKSAEEVAAENENQHRDNAWEEFLHIVKWW